MTYERMLHADALCGLGAAVAANGFKPLQSYGNILSLAELTAQFQIEAYLRRCINLGTIPTRRWPLFGIEPAPVAPVKGGLMDLDDTGLMVALADFRVWIKASGVKAPETWADALSDSVHWNDQPIVGTNVVTGRPRKMADNVQDEANEVALELFHLNSKKPLQKEIAVKLAAKHGMTWSSVRDRFSVRECHKYIGTQKQQNP